MNIFCGNLYDIRVRRFHHKNGVCIIIRYSQVGKVEVSKQANPYRKKQDINRRNFPVFISNPHYRTTIAATP